MSTFRLISKFNPTGDQPVAIEKLAANLDAGIRHQTLLGVTGSGKTFTMANVIERVQKPTLVISHNKTLAMQLYQEFKEFFPENAVHYFVSYYDYYQPEAYIPQTDTYIEKDTKINEMIDALRHAATASLLTRRDVIIVASVSCIYGLGSPEEYQKASIELKMGQKISRRELLHNLVMLRYARNPIDPCQGHFRTRENAIEIYLPSGENKIAVEIEKGRITNLHESKTKTNESRKLNQFRVYPAKHFVTPQNSLNLAISNIRQELKERLAELKKRGKVLEAARLRQRTNFDLEMLEKIGYMNGIENYSRQLDFRKSGTPPHTLIDYFNYAFQHRPSENSKHRVFFRSTPGVDGQFSDGLYVSKWLCIIDESHVSIPQIRGMYAGDHSRKETLIEYGFRLPSALDNRPLMFKEFNQKVEQIIYASATPTEYELQMSKQSYRDPIPVTQGSDPCIVEQLIRPTGILDPRIEVRPTKNQIHAVIAEIKKRIAKNERSLVMALTKRLAEDIAEYLEEAGIKAKYLHSEVKTLERPETLKKLRTGEHDVIVGINLLREGLDLPEVSFIAILDADKEGFLRNITTLLQIIGRAARHIDGKVTLYADTMTGSMRAAINETNRRRKIQEKYNREHNITPAQIKKEIRKSLLEETAAKDEFPMPDGPTEKIVKSLEREMKKASREMNFELAAKIRDRIIRQTDP